MNKSDYLINPLTNRSIKRGGRVYQILTLSGYNIDNQIYIKPIKEIKEKKYNIEYKLADTETEIEYLDLETTDIDEYNVTDESDESDF